MKTMFKISKGNSKLGMIYNINLPALTTCASDAPCRKKCYANKGTFKFKNVRECYQRNLDTFIKNPDIAYYDILTQLPHIDSTYTTLYCRIHSSGDFVNREYFNMIVKVCEARPYIKFLAFTKKYSMINDYIKEGNTLPTNLNIVFSHWINYDMPNPNNLPLAIVNEFSSIDTKESFKCTGLCETCYKCWYLKTNESVLFNAH